jgi:hypothetical protein
MMYDRMYGLCTFSVHIKFNLHKYKYWFSNIYMFSGQWALMTLLNPTFSVENLIYIGYAGEPSSAIRVTRKRRTDRKKQHTDRNVLQCFVFGPRRAGKSALLNSFIGRYFCCVTLKIPGNISLIMEYHILLLLNSWCRPYTEAYNPTNEDRYAVNVVDITRVSYTWLAFGNSFFFFLKLPMLVISIISVFFCCGWESIPWPPYHSTP